MGNHYMDTVQEAMVRTYNRFPVVLDHGEGMYLYDTEGKKYLDFGAGIAVMGLGYGNREFNDALKEQIDKLIHTSNLYYNTTLGEAAEALCRVCGMEFRRTRASALVCHPERYRCRCGGQLLRKY